jgi:hypothetical protein
MNACALLLLLSSVVPPASPSPARARVVDLAWIAGHWVNADGGALSEEVWTVPEGDAMLGMWRYVSGGKARVLELLAIADTDRGPVLHLRHFDGRLVAREEKDRPLALPLVSLDARAKVAVFDGPGVPSGTVRITYRQPSPDVLEATLEKDGQPAQPFRFTRKR